MAQDLKRPESVLVVVYTAASEILLLNRVGVSFWQSVTGSMEWHETDPLQTAIREVYEETGLAVDATAIEDLRQTRRFEILPQFSHRYAADVSFNDEHWFALRLPRPVSININPKEHSEFYWAPLPEARERVWSWTNREAIDYLFTES